MVTGMDHGLTVILDASFPLLAYKRHLLSCVKKLHLSFFGFFLLMNRTQSNPAEFTLERRDKMIDVPREALCHILALLFSTINLSQALSLKYPF